MKKVAMFVAALLLVVGNALANEVKPGVTIMDAPKLQEECEQNKFAFAKKYKDQEVIVAGFVDKVTEEKFMMVEGPDLVTVHMKGLFHAFFDKGVDIPDPADIDHGSFMLLTCTRVSSGTADLFVKGMCKPVTLSSVKNNKGKLEWVTKDHAIVDNIFTPETANYMKTKFAR